MPCSRGVADDPGALAHHCGVAVGFVLRVATVLLEASVERLQATPTGRLKTTPTGSLQTTPTGATASSGILQTTPMASPTASPDLLQTTPTALSGILQTTPLGIPQTTPTASSQGREWCDELLDFMAVVLPSVRVVLDWILCQAELCACAITSVGQPLL